MQVVIKHFNQELSETEITVCQQWLNFAVIPSKLPTIDFVSVIDRQSLTRFS